MTTHVIENPDNPFLIENKDDDTQFYLVRFPSEVNFRLFYNSIFIAFIFL